MPFPSYLHRAPILVNVDTSNDFMRPDGALYVTGAEPLIERLNAFWGELQAGELAYAIGLFDSHIAETYPHTDEAKLFPMLHSVVGTPGWNYAPDINLLNGKCPIGYFLKPVFGIGGGDTGIERSTGKSETSLLIEAQQEGRISEEEIHKMIEIAENYYKLATPAAGTLNGFTFGEHRDSFFGRIHFNVTKTALVTGVATDYCVRHATRYLLEQGFTVVLLTDLVAGIFNPIQDPTGFWNLNELLEKDDVLKRAVKVDKLILTDSATWLRQFRAAQAAANLST